MEKERYQRGSITVFLCLILVVLISVILICLESAHQAAGKAQVSIAADGAADDVLSHYEKSLFEKYGILAVNNRFDLKSFWEESLKAYSDEDTKGCHIRFQLVNSEQSGDVYLTDHNAAAFQKQVEEIVLSDLTGDGINLIRKQLAMLTESEDLSEKVSDVTDKADSIEDLESQYGNDKKEDGQEDKNTDIQAISGTDSTVLQNESTNDSTALQDESTNDSTALQNASMNEDISGIYSLISTVSSLMKHGVFGYIFDDTSEISSRRIDMDSMPSGQCTEANEQVSGSLLKKAVNESVNACYMNTYISNYMGCYTDGGYYDLEYVLGSKNTDLKNLKEAVNQLVLLRTVLNTAYLLKNQEQYAQAQVAATAIGTAIGAPELSGVITYMVIGAWACAEAVCDVRSLVHGGKVPLIKTEQTWYLNLNIAEKALKTKKDSVKADKGLLYKEYLKLLLFFHKRTRNMYRTLDMIQWNLRLKDDGFRISQCICQTAFKSEIRIDPIFYSGLTGVGNDHAIFQYSHEEVLQYQELS